MLIKILFYLIVNWKTITYQTKMLECFFSTALQEISPTLYNALALTQLVDKLF